MPKKTRVGNGSTRKSRKVSGYSTALHVSTENATGTTDIHDPETSRDSLDKTTTTAPVLFGVEYLRNWLKETNQSGQLDAEATRISTTFVNSLDKRVPFGSATETNLVEKGYVRAKGKFDPLFGSVSVQQSPELATNMARMDEYFTLDSEADRRTLIDVVLLDAMWAADTQLNAKRKRWCELPEGNMNFAGHLDYTIADWSDRLKPLAPYFLLLEAKREYNVNRDQFQLLAEMSVIMEKNHNSKTEKPIYGALTNATFWSFYKMTPDKKWMCSTDFVLARDLDNIFRILVSLIANGHH